MLRIARLRNASDVHLSSRSAPVFRTDGVLETQSTSAPSNDEIQLIAHSLLDEGGLEKLHRCGDASTTFRDDELGAFRIHAYRATSGLSLAIRLLARTVPSLESLHLPAVVGTFARKPNGLVLFAGPTGSGKTTALAALVDSINRSEAKHLITIEDPVEYEHESMRSLITHREVGKDVGSFADAIYGALRSDPDVILVGEMRDPATMHAALTAAETGHLVLATLHTGDAPQTIDRIISVFTGDTQEQVRTQLAQTLIGVVCLRLLRRSAGQGRRSAAEVLVATDAVRALIRDGKTHQLRNAIATGRQAGMQTLESHLSELVMRREVALETAQYCTDRPNEIRFAQGSAIA
ncbi:MAG: type IV pilus twitching motility protein PilT [Vulcanimicrobiaceae bacterium]